MFLSGEQILSLRMRVALGVEPQASAFAGVLEKAHAALAVEPSPPAVWHVPFRYLDREGHYRAKAPLERDSRGAYALALAYRVTGEERYAEGAAAILDAWARELRVFATTGDSMLAFSYHFPAMVFAADLLRGLENWPGRGRFGALVAEGLPMSTIDHANNWGNWGIVLTLAGASYLGDTRLFARGVQRWADLIGSQIAADGHLPREVSRSGGRRGLWYTHFALFPQTLAAEIARVNGIDLFEFTSRKGRTLRSAFARAAGWARDPSSFPYYKGDPGDLVGARAASYFEILNARWPNPDAEDVLRENRPFDDSHTGSFMTFTHGGF